MTEEPFCWGDFFLDALCVCIAIPWVLFGLAVLGGLYLLALPYLLICWAMDLGD